MVLINDGPIDICEHEQVKWRAPGLLQCCQQLRTEGSYTYHSTNVFNLDWEGTEAYDKIDASLAKWLQGLDPAFHAGIRRVYLDELMYSTEEAAPRIIMCPECLERAGMPHAHMEMFVELEIGCGGGWASA